MTELLAKAFDAETFRKEGHALVDQLADYLAAATSGSREMEVLPYHAPEEEYKVWEEDLRSGEQSPEAFFKKLMDHSIHTHHPKYMGHQVTPPVPMAALTGLMTGILNNGMAVYEMGQASSALERLVVKELARTIGYGEKGGGILTSGGTLANLTALLAARSAKTGRDVWEDGAKQPLALMVSEEAHYCVDRAARIMGWGAEGVIKVPVDEQFRMRTDLLEEYKMKAEAAGRKVIAIVGSACSTSTGMYDRLEAIAGFAEKHNLWMHIDGAHGGGAVYSSHYKKLLKGIERADSVTIDYHKMLMTPALISALVFRDEDQSYATFAQKAQYLWAKDGAKEWHNLANRTFECTKLMMSAKVYSLMRTYGDQLFDDNVTTLYDSGKTFARLISEKPGFELPYQPDSNIVCFRFAPDNDMSTEELNELNSAIRQEILEDGEFYIVQTRLHGKVYMRVSIMNPFTAEEHFSLLLEKVKAIGVEKMQKV